jgi:monovalent cation/hydrogen antiporter
VNFIEASIFILLIATLSVPLANRLRIPIEIFLFVGSCLISIMPGSPSFKINPTIVFDLFLPPILFAAAYFTSWRDFKFNLRPISLLALGLVLFTTVMVAVVVKTILPMFTWSEAFLLGAILSPTDASSMTSIIKKFEVPRRFITILEGESLVNDASALTLYRFSLGAIIYGSFSFPQAVEQFFIITLGGIAFGFMMGFIAIFILKRIKYMEAETVFTFIVAFSSYLLAEHLGFSGVISTVVAGIYFGIYLPEITTSQTRINAKASWKTLLFIINGFVFALIGFQLPSIISDLGSLSVANLAYYGLIISAVVIALRLIWVYPAAYLPRLLFPSILHKDPMPPWQLLFAIGWSGMRGIVSLAAALAIPHELFEHQNAFIFLTYFVVVATLIIPAITLPYLIRLMKLVDPEESRNKLKEEAKARMLALENAIMHVTIMADKKEVADQVYHEFMILIERMRNVIHTQIEESPYSVLIDDYVAFKKLSQVAVRAERKTLIQLRKSGEISDDVFWSLSDELDIEEVRAKGPRI